MKGKKQNMKLFTNKEISKKIVIAIVLVMLFNFISPTVSQAADIGLLFTPLMEFLLTVSDLVLAGLQGYFVGNDKIAYDAPPDAEYKEYHICYSPGVIFSNKVAGLKTNFINASSSDNETVKIKTYSYGDDYIEEIDPSDMEEDQEYEEFFEEELDGIYDSSTDVLNFEYYANPEFWDLSEGILGGVEKTEIDFIWSWNHEGKNYTAILIDVEVTEEDAMQLAAISIAGRSTYRKSP